MSLDPREFRNALGRFATGVCVITAHTQEGQPFGMTVNSFASVSLDPALVLWSIQKNSECLTHFETSDKFTINILHSGLRADSNQYAKKGDHALLEGSYRLGTTGSPVLKQAMTSFECIKDATHDGGDHLIYVGKVLDMHDHPADREPLIFYRGGYRELK